MNRLQKAIQHRDALEEKAGIWSTLMGSAELRDAEVEITKAKYEVSVQLEAEIKNMEERLEDTQLEYAQAKYDVGTYKRTLSIFRKLFPTKELTRLREKRDAIELEMNVEVSNIIKAREYLNEITGEGWQHLPTILIGVTGLLAAGYGLYSASESIDFSIGDIGRTGFDNTQPGRISIL